MVHINRTIEKKSILLSAKDNNSSQLHNHTFYQITSATQTQTCNFGVPKKSPWIENNFPRCHGNG